MRSVTTSRTLQSLVTRARIARAIVAVTFAGLSTAACKGSNDFPTVASLTISPVSASVPVNGSQQFTVVAMDADGNTLNVAPAFSIIAGGGTVNSSGLFTAGSVAGTYTNTVLATYGGVTASATVVVTPGTAAIITVTPNPTSLAINATRQFTAVARDAGGNVVAITPTWSVVNGGGSISATGLFTAGTTPGTYANTVQATSGTVSGTATVTVTAGALATITVTPNPATVAVGATQQFTAVGRDVAGNVVPVTPVWSVTNGGGTITSPGGLFTAGTTAGTFSNTVRATSGSIFGTATVNVTPGPLATITVSPNPATVQTNGTQQFTAVGKDANGNVVAITPAWSVTNGGGSIDGAGLFTAGTGTGQFDNTVRATSGSIFGTATVIVVSTPPAAPIVSLGTASTYGILAGTAVSCVTGGAVKGDIGIYPGNALTGFGPCTRTGTTHLGDAAAQTAQGDNTTAYNTLAALPCGTTVVADLGGTTLPAGVYCSATGIDVTGTLTLDGGGDPNATFVFQAGSTLTTAGNIVMINGAQAQNVYWQVGSSATIGAGSRWQGNILALTSITFVDNATLIGRALAQNGAVTLGTNNVITLP